MRSRWLLLICAVPALSLAAEPGDGIEYFRKQSCPAAIQGFRALAEKGDAQAQYYLAMAMRQQEGDRNPKSVRPDENSPSQQQEHGWLSRAARQGHAEAMAEYADDLDRGYGTAVDYPQALDGMRRALAAGSIKASQRLESWFRDGHILKPDPGQADRLRVKRGERTYSIQACASGVIRNVTSRSERSLLLARRSNADEMTRDAQAGDPEAAQWLASGARYAEPAQRDCDAAAKWYLRAGDLGLADGYHELGMMLSRGSCGAQDLRRARHLFARAAMEGHMDSLRELARSELFGHVGKPDYVAAYQHSYLHQSLTQDADDSGPTSFARRQLSPRQLAAATDEIVRNLPLLTERYKRRTNPVASRSLRLGAEPVGKPWTYALAMVDRSGSCARNYLGRCEYVPFRIELDVNNQGDTTLDCKVAIQARTFPTRERVTKDGRAVLLPGTSTHSLIAVVAGEVDTGSSTLDCNSVEKPSLADGTCLWQREPGAPNYPPASLRLEEAGVVEVSLAIPGDNALPSSVTVSSSSGFARLDEAAVNFMQSRRVRTNCPGIPTRMQFRFKLDR
jgi:TPR repeat protein